MTALAPALPGLLMRKAGKYLAIAKMGLATALAYRGEYFLRSVTLGLILFVFTVLWRTVYSAVGATSIEGFQLRDMVWYLTITESIIHGRPRLAGRVDAEVKSGTLAYTLSRPYSYVLYHYAYAMGESWTRGAMAFGLAGCLVTLLVGPPAFHLQRLGVFFVALILAATIDFLLALAVGLLAFWVEETAPFALIYDRLLMLLGGMMLPLEIFPPLLRRVAGFLPMSMIIYAPARLLIGEPGTAPWLVLAVQAGWLFVAACICLLVFRAGVRKVNVHGG